MVKMKKLIVLPLIFALSFCCACKAKTEDKTVRIFEIPKTAKSFSAPQDVYQSVDRYYMILNAPEDLRELKKMVSNYADTAEKQLPPEVTKPRSVCLCFYRESRSLP